jgi:peptidoglycan hydrolase-like protein with peptidoglycan-binding domain
MSAIGGVGRPGANPIEESSAATASAPPPASGLLHSALLSGNATLQAIAAGHGSIGYNAQDHAAAKAIQQALVSLGYLSARPGADGIFGRMSVNAVLAFQRAAGLQADGVVGPRTLRALDERLSAGGAGGAGGAGSTAGTGGAGTTPGPVPPSGGLLDPIQVGKLADGTSVTFDAASGEFKAKDAAGRPITDGTALYKAAEAVAAGDTSLFTDPKLGATGRVKLEAALEAALKTAGPAASAGSPPSGVARATRAGATLALAMAKSLPANDPLKAKLLGAYVAQMSAEPAKGLMASMQLNLAAAAEKGDVALDAAQRAALDAAKEKTFPSKPPYDTWFANGKKDLNIHQYIHPEFYDAMKSGYDRLGFRQVADDGNGTITMAKTFRGANGQDMPVKVQITKTYAEDKRPERRLFNDMNDPNVQMEMYTGHSNLGGNVLGALANGPGMQQGDKWVIDWMCRGKQVLADVYNKYPNAAYTTTTDPAYVIQSDKFLNAMLQGIADRKSYDQIWNDLGRSGFSQTGMFMKPNDPRILKVRDLDNDGKVDISELSGVDPLYNVPSVKVSNNQPYLQPQQGLNLDPAGLPGDKVMQGVNFLNTLLTYHLDTAEHPNGNDGRLPRADDQIFAAGWYKGTGDEVCKIDRKTVNGKTVYEVSVNEKYANQDIHAIGAAICYEVNKYLSIEKNGTYTEQDKLRGGLFAADYLAYMADTYEQADGIIRAMQRKYGFNDRFTWRNAIHAIDADNSGYCSPDAVRDLKRSVGSADPSIG